MNHRAAPFAGFAIVAAQFSINIGAALGKSLFPMVAKGRFDLFCRGINEVRDEWSEAKLHSGMALEPAMSLAAEGTRSPFAFSL